MIHGRVKRLLRILKYTLLNPPPKEPLGNGSKVDMSDKQRLIRHEPEVPAESSSVAE